METVDKGKFGGSGVESTLEKQTTSPVVYKLVRVEGDGKLVPATDDEVIGVVDLLKNDKSKMHILADDGKTVRCSPCPESPQVLSPFGNAESDTEKSNSPEGEMENESSCSAGLKPDFSMLKGEICLSNLSVRELCETFKATFGRETTVKDKLWLQRRIAMGLTNSCDVSTASFIIKDHKLVAKDGEEICNDVNSTFIKHSVIGHTNYSCKNLQTSHNIELKDNYIVSGKKKVKHSDLEYDCGSENLAKEQGTGKRIRKPTMRYIEELSKVESKEHGGRVIASAKNSEPLDVSLKTTARPVRNVCSSGSLLVTRLDSFGGSGVHVPYVYRVRRSRPRKNIMSLMKFHPSSIGILPEVVEKDIGLCNSEAGIESENGVLEATSAPEQIQLSMEKQCPIVSTSEHIEDLEPTRVDSSGDTSDDNLATVPTTKGGLRRKHHRAWTLSEVIKLVDGVSRYGAGRWSEIRKLAFASYSYRTSVDLKDKWRNLLKASSIAQTTSDKGIHARKHGSMPIPAAILLRVRELAEMHGQVPTNLSSIKPGGCSGRSVQEMRSGYL